MSKGHANVVAAPKHLGFAQSSIFSAPKEVVSDQSSANAATDPKEAATIKETVRKLAEHPNASTISSRARETQAPQSKVIHKSAGKVAASISKAASPVIKLEG